MRLNCRTGGPPHHSEKSAKENLITLCWNATGKAIRRRVCSRSGHLRAKHEWSLFVNYKLELHAADLYQIAIGEHFRRPHRSSVHTGNAVAAA